MATTVTKVVDPDSGSGYDYASLYDWEAAQQGDLTGVRDEIAVAKCRCTAGTADTTAVTIDGWTTSATQYIKIWTDPSESYRHNGTYQTGNKYRLEQTDACVLRFEEENVKNIGLQISISAPTGTDKDAIQCQNNIVLNLLVSDCILRGGNASTSTEYHSGLAVWSASGNIYFINNIVYNFKSSSSTTNCNGVHKYTGNSEAYYIYNSTFINNQVALALPYFNGDVGAKNIKNCIFSNSGTTDLFSLDATYALTNCSTTAAAFTNSGSTTNCLTSQTFSFVGASDFHLQANDTGALGYGLNLYNDANYPFQTDIDGQDRGGSGHFWSIGADGGYEERTFVIDPDMGTGYHYDSLYDWETAQQKTCVCPEVAKCRCTAGTADAASVTVSGWTTSATQYIKIWTDPTESYRHSGEWTTGNKYRLINMSGALSQAFTVEENYTQILGLQIRNEHDGNFSMVLAFGNTTQNVIIGHCIIDYVGSGVSGCVGVSAYYSNNAKIYNCLIQNKTTSTSTSVWTACVIIIDSSTATETIYFYNNTVIGTRYGLSFGDGTNKTIVAKNNLIKSSLACTNIGSNSWSGSSNNAVSDGTATGSSGDRVSQTFSFVDADNGDFHLQSTDEGALGYGLNLYNDANYPFQTDIDGQDRGGAAASWDIGADQYNPILLYYRTAATPTALSAEAWTEYTVPFTSEGYIQLKAEA